MFRFCHTKWVMYRFTQCQWNQWKHEQVIMYIMMYIGHNYVLPSLFFSFHSKLSRPLKSDIIKHCKYEGVKEQTIQLYKALAHLLLPMVYFFLSKCRQIFPYSNGTFWSLNPEKKWLVTNHMVLCWSVQSRCRSIAGNFGKSRAETNPVQDYTTHSRRRSNSPYRAESPSYWDSLAGHAPYALCPHSVFVCLTFSMSSVL